MAPPSFVLRGTKGEMASPRAEKVLMTARYASVPISNCEDEEEGESSTSSSDQLKSITTTTPFAKSLVLSFQNQLHITTSNAMMRTIASVAPASCLLGNSPIEDAIVDSWLCFIWTGLDVNLWVLEQQQQHGQGDGSKQQQQEQQQQQPLTMIETILQKNYQILDSHLSKEDRVYMVGNTITLADISLGVSLKIAIDREKTLGEYPNLSRWYKMMIDKKILQS